MGSQSFFCDLIHATCADLDFHPSSLRTHHRRVQGLIAIGFGIAQPIAQALRSGRVLIRDHRIHFPALCFFQLGGYVENDSDGEQIIHFLELHPLLLHLVPDGVNAFGSTVHLGNDLGSFQFFPNGSDEFIDVAGPFFFCLCQFACDLLVRLGLHVLHRQIFHFRLDVVQSHAMRQGRIDVNGFGRDLELLFGLHAIERTHVVQAIGQLDEDHPRIVGQRQ